MSEAEKADRILQNLDQLLFDTNKELDVFHSISEQNNQAMLQMQQKLLANFMNNSKLEETFETLLKVKKENITKCIASNDQKITELKLHKDITNYAKTVEKLAKELEHLTLQYEMLKNGKDVQEKDDLITEKLLKKALKLYTTYFQFIIDKVDNEDSNKYSVLITFLFDGVPSKNPIKVVFNAELTTLLDVDAGALLTKEQLNVLVEHVASSKDCSSLFTALRHAALLNMNK